MATTVRPWISGGPPAGPVIRTLIWSAGITAVFATLAIVGAAASIEPEGADPRRGTGRRR